MKRNMKALAAILLLITTACTVMTGCGKKEQKIEFVIPVPETILEEVQQKNPDVTYVSMEGTMREEIKDYEKLDMCEYLYVEEEGMSGQGGIRDLRIDVDKFLEEQEKTIKKVKYTVEKNPAGEKVVYVHFENHSIGMTADTLEELIEDLLASAFADIVMTDETHEKLYQGILKNGDQIGIHWIADEYSRLRLSQILGKEVVYRDFEYTVHKLEEPKQIDPLETVIFSNMYGNNGEAYLSLPFASAFISTPDGYQAINLCVDVTEETNRNFSNGDQVRVYLKDDYEEERFFEDYGIVFTRTEGIVEIRGLNAYGQPDAAMGQHATVNLNDYIVIGEWNGLEGDGEGFISIDFKSVYMAHTKSVNENVNPEDLLYYSNAVSKARYLLVNCQPFQLVSSSYENQNAGNNGFSIKGDIHNGDIIPFSFQPDEEILEEISKIMNVDFVYNDFAVKVDGLK